MVKRNCNRNNNRSIIYGNISKKFYIDIKFAVLLSKYKNIIYFYFKKKPYYINYFKEQIQNTAMKGNYDRLRLLLSIINVYNKTYLFISDDFIVKLLQSSLPNKYKILNLIHKYYYIIIDDTNVLIEQYNKYMDNPNNEIAYNFLRRNILGIYDDIIFDKYDKIYKLFDANIPIYKVVIDKVLYTDNEKTITIFFKEQLKRKIRLYNQDYIFLRNINKNHASIIKTEIEQLEKILNNSSIDEMKQYLRDNVYHQIINLN